jgi:hypothetical protein
MTMEIGRCLKINPVNFVEGDVFRSGEYPKKISSVINRPEIMETTAQNVRLI